MNILHVIFAGVFVILISGCGPTEFDKMVAKTKQQAQPATVRQAALPLFSLTEIKSSGLPKEIVSLPLFDGDWQDMECSHLTTNALMVMTGGGFGHWGLIICKDKPQTDDTNGLHAIVTPWSDGVFFWQQM